MTEIAWTFELGEIPLTLIGPSVWIDPFVKGWAAWASEASGWEVRVEQDVALSPPRGPLFGTRPCFDQGICRLEAPGFSGEIMPQNGTAHLQAHPEAHVGDVAYFVRTVSALQAFDAGALLFHAAGVVHRDEGYALFGHSGSGKTTAARLSLGKTVLSDDLLLLCPSGQGWQAWATPFGHWRLRGSRVAHLRAILRLVQALEERLDPMSRAAALGELVANSPVVNANPLGVADLLTRWDDILSLVPVYLLHFRKSAAYWEVIDAQFR